VNVVVPPPRPPQVVEKVVAWILENGRHPSGCRAATDPHRHPDRGSCDDYPCSCGLSAILDELNPSIIHQIEL